MHYQIDLGPWGGIFAVPTCVVDKHLKLASGLALKVLLLLLRTQIPLSAEEIATRLGQSQGDVRDALAYWEQAGLLSLK